MGFHHRLEPLGPGHYSHCHSSHMNPCSQPTHLAIRSKAADYPTFKIRH